MVGGTLTPNIPQPLLQNTKQGLYHGKPSPEKQAGPLLWTTKS